ncbi:MAG TPA: TonB-dependent receptor [Terriglobales bacterium]|nr:TonB-dependent receptor [Terriglobales bacterium]
MGNWMTGVRRSLFAMSLLAGIILIMHVNQASAQSAAALNGSVKDSTDAVVVDANVKLTNVKTGTEQTRKTNSTGQYVFVDVQPGSYTLEVSKEGFATVKQTEFTLEVNQTARIDLTLQVGAAASEVNVTAEATEVETSTAELGSVVGTRQVNNLPLNGRNFTQLMLLAPGMSPANPSGNSSGFPSKPIGAFVFPSVNGQTNRSNMYLLDGVNNYGSIRDTYAVQPTIDDVLEFKVQSHNDEAQFGQVLGGIVNLATKSGTNSFHGTAWEFIRNDALDAQNYFNPGTPLKQNEFGFAIGGPVLLPRYNGRNKTFFYGSYEGFRNHTSAPSPYTTPTPEQLNGDFSAVDSQIYNPYSTHPDSDPENVGGFVRDPFMCSGAGTALPTNPDGTQAAGTPCNILPTNLFNPTMLKYAQEIFPKPIDTGIEGTNGRDISPAIIRQDQISLRLDHQLSDRDRIFVRYTEAWQPDSVSGGYTGLVENTKTTSYNLAVNYTHNFGNSAVMQLTMGRVSAEFDTNPTLKAPSDFLTTTGFSPNLYNHQLNGKDVPLIPSVSVDGYLGGANYVGLLHYSNIWEYKGDLSKVSGHHSFRMGASLATDGWEQPFLGSEVDFEGIQTSSLGANVDGGDGMASMLLGVPTYSEVDNVYSLLHGGKIIGTYFQDQWRVSDRLTVNLGLRYDLTVNPREGKSSNGSDITGNMDLNNGTYVLQKPAPACSASQPAPCLPNGTLPDHVVIAKNGKLIKDNYDNIQPRIGVAYRLTDKMALRAAYGRFYDNWAAVTQNQSNYTQSWPNVAFLSGEDLNDPFPNAFAEDPLHLSGSTIVPADNPFDQSAGFLDPRMKNPRSDQWNVGIQRQLTANSVVTVNYVGSNNSRESITLTGNAATTFGTGDPQLRAPYQYIQPQAYVRGVGKSHYNALQVSSEMKTTKGLSYSLSYTYSKAINYGCNGYAGGCDVQDPNHFENDKGPAGYDLPNIFSGSWVYDLPFGKGKKWSTGNRAADYIFGNWQLNGILSLASGTPYDVQLSQVISNLNNVNGVVRPNVVGDPYAGATKLHPITAAAFETPATGTIGDMKRNSLRTDWRRNLDLSVFRSFPISETKRIEFRFEAFNATNTPVFGTPRTNLANSNFGQVRSTANTERQLQGALKFYF